MPALGVILLATALTSLIVYLSALFRLVQVPHRRGLVRTGACRVVAAVLYLGVGIVAITHRDENGLLSLVVFIVSQLMWQANSLADLRLTRRENARTAAQKGASDAVTATGRHPS